jgi:predicted DNA-binding transcriptional regulator AlpA
MIVAHQGDAHMAVNKANEPQSDYITVEEAATTLQVSRSNVYYYMTQLEIVPKKFPLDRKSYISRANVERIKVMRGSAATSTRINSDDVLVWLAGLGLAITPHSDPSYGWGYSWQGGNWEGPCGDTPIAAIQAAFGQAVRHEEAVRQMPFLPAEPKLFWWDGAEWYAARRNNGEVEVFTGDLTKNNGYERLDAVEAQREAWLQPWSPTGDETLDEERERARLAANILYSSYKSYYRIDPIDWQEEGLKATVTFNDVQLGDLLSVYNHMREDDNFLSWLRSKGVSR